MLIPKYWASASAPAQNRWRHTVTVRRWGWSDDSQQAAEAHAQERLRQALAAYAQGQASAHENRPGYNGAQGLPICEEVLARHGSAVLTRNSYGAHCINTPDVLFADVDDAQYTGYDIGCLIALLALVTLLCALYWLLSPACKPPRSPQPFYISCALLLSAWIYARWQRWRHRPAAARRASLERIRRFASARPDWSLRLYQTPAGLRLLATHRTFTPGDPAVQELFKAVRVDPVYQRMCLLQQCFRARVTAKPWRIGINAHIRNGSRAWPIARASRPSATPGSPATSKRPAPGPPAPSSKRWAPDRSISTSVPCWTGTTNSAAPPAPYPWDKQKKAT